MSSNGSERKARISALHAELDAIASSRRPGALLSLDVEPQSMRRLREEGATDAESAEVVHAAYELVVSCLPGVRSARLAWSRYDFVLRGAREESVAVGERLLASLTTDPRTCRVAWLVVLIRIFEGEAQRTLRCDPGYDLASLKSSTLVWVDPYPGDDWTEPQRYPSTTILRQT